MAYDQCESYFVEGPVDDNRRAISEAQRAKQLARERHDWVGKILSDVTVGEYMCDGLEHMTQMEMQTLPDVASIDLQAEIQWYMRPYLLDFLIEAHNAFQLLPETLHLAINILDRYCSKRVVYKRHYQLVGCAALFIAAKFGDKKDKTPTIRELKAMCCGLYDDEMFVQMEWHVLQTLDWIVGAPTIDAFLQIALRTLAEEDKELEHMTLFICEIALFNKEFVSTPPSVLVRTAFGIAKLILRRSTDDTGGWVDWRDTATLYSLNKQLGNASPVLNHKYESQHLSSVSIIMERFLYGQNLLARMLAPVTPPCELKSTGDPNQVFGGMPQTPQRHNFSSGNMITPPITPDGSYFVPNEQRLCPDAPRLPVTPTPESTERRMVEDPAYHHHEQQSNRLAPIIQY